MSEIFVKLRIKELLKGNMKRYLLFGFVEIFLVVAGILIALAINNWNIRKTERNDEVHIYKSLKERILEDKRVILDDMEYNNNYLVQFEYADRIILLSEGRVIVDGEKHQVLSQALLFSPQINRLVQSFERYGVSNQILTVSEALGMLS